MDFRLAPPPPAPPPSFGSEFLLRGYYFFLSAPCDAALFAQTNTSDNVRLVARRTRGRGWAPLTHISYIVVRVVAPYDTGPLGPISISPSGGDRIAELYAQEPTQGEGIAAAVAGALERDGGEYVGATAGSGGGGVGGGGSRGGGGGGRAIGGAAAAAAGAPGDLGPCLAWAGDSGGGRNVIDVILDAYERRRALVARRSPPPAPVWGSSSGVTLTMPVPANASAEGLRAAFEADLGAAQAAYAAHAGDGTSRSSEGGGR